jgi:hypothetical protein
VVGRIAVVLLVGLRKGVAGAAFWRWQIGDRIDIKISLLAPSAFLISGSLLAGSSWPGTAQNHAEQYGFVQF